MEWFLTGSGNEQMDARQAAYMQKAYYNTFCAEEQGRQVLCHLEVIVDEMMEAENLDSREKTAVFLFLKRIKENCGILNRKAVVDAMCKTAAGFMVQEPEEEKKLSVPEG